ncbi:hypothetical protein GCK72_017017 [Caenorhabditis remanei]|uniref:Uncharacterized protein n=1 Tax=Caenorhabditis remanei TaxID=31234 RepID=A0A6A5G673_CAERE|nr:hypothetical protein GCK72_017017 [Caenorhabditis remanei]KAF1750467.1 hypothetical protein GCK72_017017 [Caenorhabditis remanei]
MMGRMIDLDQIRLKPPLVNKVDGRARILRPLRLAAMQSNQQPTTSSASGASGAQRQPPPSSTSSASVGTIPHSQSMPVLGQARGAPGAPSGAAPAASGAPGATPAAAAPSRAALTLPSNTTDKGAVPILNWAESMRIRLNKLRTKSQKAMDEALRENQTEEEMSRTRDALSEVAGVYNEMFRASNMKCRLNAVFDKRGMYKAVEAAIHTHELRDPHCNGLFDRMQQSMDERTAIERNILAVTDTFKQNPVSSPRGSRLSAPPPIKFGKHFEEANKGLVLAMDAVFNRTRGDAMSWKFKRISHRSFRNSKTLVEVQYCTRRPATEKEFVSCMKALLVLNFGILEDLILGGEDESLYDTESIYQSKRKVYREFTKSAREIILCSPVTKFTLVTAFFRQKI